MNSSDKGSRIQKGHINIINLFGTWKEMGCRYGSLMAGEIQSMYRNGVEKHLIARMGLDVLFVKEQSYKFYENYPYRYKQLLCGIAETCGLGMDELVMVNGLQRVLSLVNKNANSTSIAAWGDYAKDSLVYGRNYDNESWMSELSSNLVVSVFHPADGSLAVATIGYAGQIYVVNGMNEAGIMLSLNSAMYSGGALWYESRVPSVVKLFDFLLGSTNLDELETSIQTTKANFAYLVGAVDSQSARFYEWPVFEVKRRESHSRQGLAVMSNHFTEPSWALPKPDDVTNGLTISRRQNLLSLAKHFKGVIDEVVMMKMLDTKYEDLGATTESTLYQIVGIPETYKLWVKIPGHEEWTEINMKEYLCPEK